MTDRPTDDFDEFAEEQVTLNNADEDDAAFGEGADRAPATFDQNPDSDFEEQPAETTDTGYQSRRDDNLDLTESADDSDFVADDMADIEDELSDEFPNPEDEDTYEEDADPLADGDYEEEAYEEGDEGTEYDIVEGDEQPAANQRRANNNGDKRYFGKYTQKDLIWYGGMGVGGLVAAIILITSVLGDSPAPQQQALPLLQEETTSSQDSDQQAPITGMVVPNIGEVPRAQDLPAPAAEPSPDGIGIAGALSTLKDDDIAPAPQVPAGVPTPGSPEALAPMGNDSLAPLPEVAAPVAPTATAPVVTEVAPQAPAPVVPAEEPLAPVAQVTAPPTLGVDNTALAERMSELGVKIAELNAQLTQINDSVNNLQKTTDKLDKQNQELSGKATDLGSRVDQQNQKIDQKVDELSKQREALLKQAKEAGNSNNGAALDDLKISVAQLERRIAALGKSQGVPQAAPAPAPRAPQSFDGPPPPAATPVKPAKKPATDVVEVPSAPSHTQPAQVSSDYTTGQGPRSPKARDQAGTLYEAPRMTWVLRAATPSMAWLSPRAGSAELRRVAPGDTVDGIGQVIEIRQEGGRWAVIGTQGVIR